MAETLEAGAASPAPSRIAGYDVARALAICFMILENFKVLMLGHRGEPHLLVWAASLTNGRSAPLFVVLAGVGLSLMSRAAREANDRVAFAGLRRTIALRSLFFLVLGNLFILVWWMDILHFYAWYVALGGLLFLRASGRTLVVSAASIAVLGSVVAFLRGTAYFESVEYWSPLGMLRDTFLDGIHPVLPWLSFVLAGMWLGRLDLGHLAVRRAVLIGAAFAWAAAELLSLLLVRLAVAGALGLGSDAPLFLLTTSMCPPGPLYLISATASSFGAIAACHVLAARWPTSRAVDALVAAGQLSLTLYIGHAIVGAGALWAFGALEGHSPLFLVAYWAGYFLLSVLFAVAWRRRFGRGPLEWLMRKVSGSRSRPRGSRGAALAVLAEQVTYPDALAPIPKTRPTALWALPAFAAAGLAAAGIFGLDGEGARCGEPRLIAPGQTVTQEMTALCPDLWYDLAVAREQTVTLRVRSAHDPYLEAFRDGEAAPFLEDDDSGSALNPRATVTLSPGRYRLKLRPYCASTGRVSLTVE